METNKKILVLYHGNCMDGSAGAWIAWKKLGGTAEYLPQERTSIPDSSIFQDKEVYVIDYSFSKEQILSFEKSAKKFVCIDHHISAKEAVESLKEYTFDTAHSGSYLAWKYFFPEEKVPLLIEYISDSDTWTHALPDYEDVDAYIYRETERANEFLYFEDLNKELSSNEGFERAKTIGKLFREAHESRVSIYEKKAEIINFEGYDIYAVNAPRDIRSELGHRLAKKTGLFSMIFSYEKGIWKCSLRGVKDFDVSVIAIKHGGGGHKNAAAFSVKAEFPIVFRSKE